MTFIERHIGIMAIAIAILIALRIFVQSDIWASSPDRPDHGYMQYRSWFDGLAPTQSDLPRLSLADMITETMQRHRTAPEVTVGDADLITGSTGKAEEPAAKPDKTTAEQKPSAPAAETKAPETGPLSPATEAGAERTLLERLGLRRSELDKREEELADREALLQAAEKRLAERTEELKKLEAELKAQTDQRNAELTSLKPIITIYETMKPKDAARVFEKLEFPVLLSVSTAMNPRKLSDILSQMDPALAGKLTKTMSGAMRAAMLPQPAAKMQADNELPDLSPQGTP